MDRQDDYSHTNKDLNSDH